MRKRGRPQHVYVMLDACNYCKVGISHSPAGRLPGVIRERGLPVSLAWFSETPLIDAEPIEVTAHLTLLPYRKGGEWFDVSVADAVAVVKQAIQRVGQGIMPVRTRLLRHPEPFYRPISDYWAKEPIRPERRFPQTADEVDPAKEMADRPSRAALKEALVREVEDALIAHGSAIYQYRSSLVKPYQETFNTCHGSVELFVGLDKVKTYHLVDEIIETGYCEKHSGQFKNYNQLDMSMRMAEILISWRKGWRLPTITKVVTTPPVSSDDLHLLGQGYDAVTGIYHQAHYRLS